MSSGSQITTYYAVEDTAGVTPDVPAWQTLRFTSNALTPTVNTTTSDEIRDTRMSTGMINTSNDFGGSVGGEFSAQTIDDLLEGAFYGNWTDDVLTIGDTRNTYTIAKSYRDIDVYSVFRGCHVGEFTLDVPEDGKITYTFTMAGLDYEDGVTSFVTDPAPANENPLMGSGNSVGTILIDGESLEGRACISAFTLTVNNNLQLQRCLGKLGPGAQIATEAGVSGNLTMAWSQRAYQLWRNMFTRTPVELVLPLVDSLGNRYTIRIPQAELDGELPDGGKRDIVDIQLTYTARIEPVTITRELVVVADNTDVAA